jgi:hypothetical protein
MALLRFASLAAAAMASAAGLPVLTEVCDATNANQSFTSSCAAGVCSFASGGFPGQCISSDGVAALANLVLAPCDSGDAKQQFVFTASSGQVQQMPATNNLCWNVDGGANEPAGTGIILYDCGSRKTSLRIAPNDVFTIAFPTPLAIFSNSSGDSGLCLDTTPPPPPPPPPFHWAYLVGLLSGADALPPATMAIADAEAACMAAPLCYGISWSGPLNPATPQMFSFKTSTVPQGNAGNTLLRCGVQTPC